MALYVPLPSSSTTASDIDSQVASVAATIIPGSFTTRTVYMAQSAAWEAWKSTGAGSRAISTGIMGGGYRIQTNAGAAEYFDRLKGTGVAGGDPTTTGIYPLFSDVSVNPWYLEVNAAIVNPPASDPRIYFVGWSTSDSTPTQNACSLTYDGSLKLRCEQGANLLTATIPYTDPGNGTLARFGIGYDGATIGCYLNGVLTGPTLQGSNYMGILVNPVSPVFPFWGHKGIAAPTGALTFWEYISVCMPLETRSLL